MKRLLSILLILLSLIYVGKPVIFAVDTWKGVFYPSLPMIGSESIKFKLSNTNDLYISGRVIYPADSRGSRPSDRIYNYTGKLIGDNIVRISDSHWYVYDNLKNSYHEIFKSEKGEYTVRDLTKSTKNESELRADYKYDNGRKYGFVNSNEDVVIPFKYDDAWSFSEGLANVKLGEKWGFIDSKGEIIIPIKYDMARPFKNGIAPVSDGGAYVYIDKNGQQKFYKKFSYADSFWEDNIAYVVMKSNEGGSRSTFIDINGNEIFKRRYDDVTEKRCQGLIIVELNNKKGLCNHLGREVIPVIYDRIYESSCWNNLFVVEKDGKIGCVDGTNNIIIPFMPHMNGTFIYPENSCIIIKQNGKYGIRSLKGDMVLSEIYEYIDTPYLDNSGLCSFKDEGKWGILNHNGNIMVAPEFDYVVLDNNYARVKKNRDVYFINSYDGSYHADRNGYYSCPQNIIDTILNNKRYVY